MSLLSMTAVMFFSEAPCAMALTLTLLFPNARNIRPLIPWWFFMFSPTRAMMDNAFSTRMGLIFFVSMSSAKASSMVSCAKSAAAASMPKQIECSEDACVIMTTFM